MARIFIFLFFLILPFSLQAQSLGIYFSHAEASQACERQASIEKSKPSIKDAFCQGNELINKVVKDGKRFVYKYDCHAIPTVGQGITCGSALVFELVDNDCSSRPSLGNTRMNVSSAGVGCINGCAYEMDGMGAYGYNSAKKVFVGVAKSWKPSGRTCSVNDIPAEPENRTEGEFCTSIGSNGSQSCVKENGEHCIKFASGGQHCWNPDFTGTEIVKDGDTWVGRERSPNKPTPSSSTGNNPSTTEGSSSVVINNYTYNTSYGSTGSAGGSNGGGSGGGGSGNNNGGGSGSGGSGNGNGSGDGDGDGDGTSAGGGSSCSDPPTCSGDAATCAVYRQVWLQRCDGHGQLDGNAVGDFDLPSDVENSLNGDDDDSWRSGEDDVLEKTEINGDALLSKLDSSGFLGGGSCPPPVNISVGGKATMNFSFAAICDMLASASYLVMMLAYYLAIRIITKTK